MEKAQYVHKKKKRYLAQTLEEFERLVEPLLPNRDDKRVKDFKGTVRRKMHALAEDSVEIMSLEPGVEINAAATALRERVEPETRGATTA